MPRTTDGEAQPGALPNEQPPHEGRQPGIDAALARHVADVLAPVGGVWVRRMGAIYGLIRRETGPDVPIALVHRGAVFFKVGPESVTRYIACGMRPFRPGPRQALRGYWRVPVEVLADATALCDWAAAATDATLRFGKGRGARRPRKRRRTRTTPGRSAE